MMVFICGDMKGGSASQLKTAQSLSHGLLSHGLIPVHCFGMFGPCEGVDRSVVMTACKEILSKCDCVLAVRGSFNSLGAKEEIEFAQAQGIPVLTCVEDLLEHAGFFPKAASDAFFEVVFGY